LQIASNRKEHGTIIIAQKQTDGKGRLNRKWVSAKGGIWFSIILHPKFSIEESTLLPIAASLALSNTIQKTLKIKTKVKWPNDLTINGKKVAGMLIDVSSQSNNIESAVIGIGLNYKIKPNDVKKKLAKSPNFYGVETLLNETQIGNPIQLIKEFAYQFEEIIEQMTNGMTPKIIDGWTRNSETIHKKVTVNTTNGKISGIALKINNDGSLKIKTKHKTERVFVGDIAYS